jgi:hypothetical protein
LVQRPLRTLIEGKYLIGESVKFALPGSLAYKLHELCLYKAPMAKTIKIAKYMKTPRIEGRPFIQQRPAKPGLYLLELRSHAAGNHSPLPKRKLVVTIDLSGGESGLPKPIKITHR